MNAEAPRYTPLLRGPRAALRRLGEALGRNARAGDVLALSGGLGAGKTFLTGALARGLGVPAEVRVASPTFNLVLRHEGRLPLYHADLYRLESREDFDSLGLLEQALDGVCVLEWPERFADALPAQTLWLRLERATPLTRSVAVAGPRELAERLLGPEFAATLLRSQG